MLNDAMEFVREENVVQVIIDNVANSNTSGEL